jgi:hypothetical protein
LRHPANCPASPLTAEQRLLLLDTWQRSGLPAGDFAALIGMSKHTLYDWKRKFQAEGPAGLVDRPRGGPSGSRLPEVTRRAILMLKQANPAWGCQRISEVPVKSRTIGFLRLLRLLAHPRLSTITRIVAPMSESAILCGSPFRW